MSCSMAVDNLTFFAPCFQFVFILSRSQPVRLGDRRGDMEVGDGNMNVKVVHTGGHLAAHGAQITGMFIQCVSRRLVTNGIYHKMSIKTTVKLVS